MLDKDYSNVLNNKLLNIKLDKLEKDYQSFKLAYPNNEQDMNVPGEHNLHKWIQTLKDVYYKNIQQKMPWNVAISSSIEDWNPVEKLDFNNWANYYQQNNHLKYNIKTAQHYINEESDEDENPVMPGYLVPNAYINDIQSAKDSAVNDISNAEKNKLLQKHKKKIVSRLDSIEKLLRDEEGYLLSENENDLLIESIHSLKKKVYSLRKKASEIFLKDLVIREANSLINKGFYKAASFLYVIAEEKVPENNITSKASPEITTLPYTENGAPAVGEVGISNQPVIEDTSMTSSPQIGQINNSSSRIDVFEEEDPDNLDILEVNDDNLLSLAQDAGLPAPPPPAPPPAPQVANQALEAPPEPIEEVSVEGSPSEQSPSEITVTDSSEESNFDKILEDTLSKVTIEDVVRKMEEISKIFKTREIPRQLSIVDMMLDKLNLSSFFPSLSEATNKALESNNYILTRMEDMIMQLSGALKTKTIDLVHTDRTPDNVSGVRENLEQQEQAEKDRKEKRKQLADKALEERSKEEAPDLEVTENDLEQSPTPMPVTSPLPPAQQQLKAPIPPPV